MDEMRTSIQKGRGFTLIELLTVMAVISVLAVLTVPAVSTIVRGSNLNLAGQLVGGQFATAWQEAVSKNCEVEVRFYELTSGVSPGWRGIQLWRIKQTATGPVPIALSRVLWISEGIRMTPNADLSPLLQSGPRQGTVTLPTYGPTSYRWFRFRANGSLESSVGDNNFVTLVNATDSADHPKNYYTIQINSLTGKTTVFRP